MEIYSVRIFLVMSLWSVSVVTIITSRVDARITCPPGWTPFSDVKCFRGVKGRMTWDAAQRYCRHQGGELASIMDMEDNEAVLDVVDKLKYEGGGGPWIGLKREGHDFRWADGSPLIYSNFGLKALEYSCVFMWAFSGTW